MTSTFDTSKKNLKMKIFMIPNLKNLFIINSKRAVHSSVIFREVFKSHLTFSSIAMYLIWSIYFSFSNPLFLFAFHFSVSSSLVLIKREMYLYHHHHVITFEGKNEGKKWDYASALLSCFLFLWLSLLEKLNEKSILQNFILSLYFTVLLMRYISKKMHREIIYTASLGCLSCSIKNHNV